ncbi:putative membrane protein [Lyngbya aestuarii BL J]|uniref:Putative membrane protein n=1 Tax=Lyngbya aestuarii BL J TaxID=1348334 RepID=U7QPS6_9CYAN|nr:hypothetical protein [Lyngbya aestuarii]ERT09873.1 putative membrane protein [Lyngbya aestuarii BL J]
MSQLNLPFKIDFSFSKNQALIENSIIVAFIFFGLVGILHHEIWRDEFQAWLLARDSASLMELFHNMRSEGHPGLWHLCLYGLSRITQNPLIMQIFHLSVSVVIVSLIVKFSPFSPLQKFLLSFGYYFFYEYTIISRNYNLGVLFIILFCVIYSKSKVKPILLATLLALMANANAFAFILSFAFSLTLIDEFYFKLKANQLNRKKLLISFLILTSGWAISFLQIIRPLISQEKVIRPIQSSAEQIQSSPSLLQEIERLGTAVTDIWRSYVPIPFHLDNEFWNTNILVHNTNFPSVAGIPLGAIIAGLASLILLAISIKILYQKRLLLTIYLFGTGSIFAFNYLIFQGVMRHRGHLFILLIACLWLLEKELLNRRKLTSKQQAPSQFRSQFLTVILSVHLLGGFHAYTVDLFYPFSVGRETAQYIQDNNLDQLTIVGQRYRQAAVLSGYLKQPIYYPDLGEFGSFWTSETKMEKIKTIEGFIRDNPNETLLVLTYELESDSVFPDDIKITELKRFVEPTIEPYENVFYIYTAREIETPLDN